MPSKGELNATNESAPKTNETKEAPKVEDKPAEEPEPVVEEPEEPEVEEEPEVVVAPEPEVPKEVTCPLITAEKVKEVCKRAELPKVSLAENTCVFTFGENGEFLVNISSQLASPSDFDAWMASIETLDEAGELLPKAASGEYRKIKYYGWFTGSRLMIAKSNNVLACTGGFLDDLLAASSTKVGVAGEKGVVDSMKLNIVKDEKAVKVDNAVTAKALMINYDNAGELVAAEDVNGTGELDTTLEDGTYYVYAELEDVVIPKGSHLEGWLVDKNPWSTIDAGKFQVLSDKSVLVYASKADLSDHDYLIVTLEKDGVTGPTTILFEGHAG